MSSRRQFLHASGAALLGLPTVGLSHASVTAKQARAVLKPARLRPGQTVGVVSPAGSTHEAVRFEILEETLAALGLQMKLGAHAQDRWGYLAGTDAERAADLNALFADPDVDAILAVTGGWGAARLLPHLDYDVIRANPKVLMGYSDVTVLLIALYAKTGLVTFHGPNGTSRWNAFSVDHMRRVLFDAEAAFLQNPTETGDNLVQVEHRIRTITPGRARGRLVGGNLTVLTAIVGSDYLPDWRGHLLFLEDINEGIYRIDRMLTQLKLAGILDQVAGVVFGKCTRCDADSGYSSFTLEEVLVDHLRPLGVPAWHGAMIGHLADKFTVPLGVEAEIDAETGTIRLLEPAVT